MNRVKISSKMAMLIAMFATALTFTACGSKTGTDVDFSIVPVANSNGEYQYIDVSQKGKIVINPQFGEADFFRNGLALVKTSGKNGKYGYIDKKGKYVISPTYDYAQDFGDGAAWAQIENQPPALIDKTGKILMQADSLVWAYPFAGGMATAGFYSQGRVLVGFIKKDGEVVLSDMEGEKYKPLLNDGLYAFHNSDSKKWGYRNINGEIVINEQFDSAGTFFEGIAEVKQGGKWGAIDKKGDFIINPQYDDLGYEGDGLFIVQMGKKYGWLNKKGDVVINPQLDMAMPFCGTKLAAVEMGKKWAYVDRKGQMAINPQFDYALPFFGDYAPVLSGKIGFIDKEGTFAVPPIYEGDLGNIYKYIYAVMQKANGGLPIQYLEFDRGFLPYQGLKAKKTAYEEAEREKAQKKAEEEKTEYEAKMKALAEKKESDNAIPAEQEGSVTYEGHAYKTANMPDGKVWFAENMDYAAGNSACYEGKAENCAKCGRLYDFETAKLICPKGWHLPSDAEWKALGDAAGSSAGTALKSKSGWEENGNGEDNYGFSALACGYLNTDGNFHNYGSSAHFWSATSKENAAWDRNLYADKTGMTRNSHNKAILFSVRCVKD